MTIFRKGGGGVSENPKFPYQKKLRFFWQKGGGGPHPIQKGFIRKNEILWHILLKWGDFIRKKNWIFFGIFCQKYIMILPHPPILSGWLCNAHSSDLWLNFGAFNLSTFIIQCRFTFKILHPPLFIFANNLSFFGISVNHCCSSVSHKLWHTINNLSLLFFQPKTPPTPTHPT